MNDGGTGPKRPAMCSLAPGMFFFSFLYLTYSFFDLGATKSDNGCE